MFKKFDEFVNENMQSTADPQEEKALIKSAVYEIAKETGYHIRYVNQDKMTVNFIVPTSSGQKVAKAISNFLSSFDIDHRMPYSDTDRPPTGDKQFLKVDYKQLVEFGKSVYPRTDYGI